MEMTNSFSGDTPAEKVAAGDPARLKGHLPGALLAGTLGLRGQGQQP